MKLVKFVSLLYLTIGILGIVVPFNGAKAAEPPSPCLAIEVVAAPISCSSADLSFSANIKLKEPEFSNWNVNFILVKWGVDIIKSDGTPLEYFDPMNPHTITCPGICKNEIGTFFYTVTKNKDRLSEGDTVQATFTEAYGVRIKDMNSNQEYVCPVGPSHTKLTSCTFSNAEMPNNQKIVQSASVDDGWCFAGAVPDSEGSSVKLSIKTSIPTPTSEGRYTTFNTLEDLYYCITIDGEEDTCKVHKTPAPESLLNRLIKNKALGCIDEFDPNCLGVTEPIRFGLADTAHVGKFVKLLYKGVNPFTYGYKLQSKVWNNLSLNTVENICQIKSYKCVDGQNPYTVSGPIQYDTPVKCGPAAGCSGEYEYCTQDTGDGDTTYTCKNDFSVCSHTDTEKCEYGRNIYTRDEPPSSKDGLICGDLAGCIRPADYCFHSREKIGDDWVDHFSCVDSPFCTEAPPPDPDKPCELGDSDHEETYPITAPALADKCGPIAGCQENAYCGCLIPEGTTEKVCRCYEDARACALLQPFRPISGISGPIVDLRNLLKFVFSLIGPIGIAVFGIPSIIINGYKLMNCQGDPRECKDAKDGLTAAIVGIVFVLFSVNLLKILVTGIIG